MQFSPVVDNIQIEGTLSQTFDIVPSIYLMIENGKLFVIIFLTFIFYFRK